MLTQEPAGANLMGSDLYNNLIRYFVTHLKGLRDVSALIVLVTPGSEFQAIQETDLLHDEALLRYYAAEWLRYTTGANYINRLFTYLNRHWVKRERDEGRKNVYPVYTVRQINFTRPYPSNLLLTVSTRAMEEQPFCAYPTKTREISRCHPPFNRTAAQWRND